MTYFQMRLLAAIVLAIIISLDIWAITGILQ